MEYPFDDFLKANFSRTSRPFSMDFPSLQRQYLNFGYEVQISYMKFRIGTIAYDKKSLCRPTSSYSSNLTVLIEALFFGGFFFFLIFIVSSKGGRLLKFVNFLFVSSPLSLRKKSPDGP